uniref:Uncharacterized protein n=1 Tax=Arundo donax TaxID=35708 RepID=A0A0A9DGZ1_ARUDO
MIFKKPQYNHFSTEDISRMLGLACSHKSQTEQSFNSEQNVWHGSIWRYLVFVPRSHINIEHG